MSFFVFSTAGGAFQRMEVFKDYTVDQVVKEEKPDLICLDLQMPGEWGPRFYRKLRKDQELKDDLVSRGWRCSALSGEFRLCLLEGQTNLSAIPLYLRRMVLFVNG